MSAAVVCDAGPIIALGGAGYIDLLRQLFEPVIVPGEVSAEILALGEEAMGARAFREAEWIQVLSGPTPGMETLLEMLDPGEASVIATASSLKHATVLMDEFTGRRVAAEMFALKVAGTGRILVEAKRRGLIPKVQPVLAKMRSNRYWLADKVVSAILTQANEQSPPP